MFALSLALLAIAVIAGTLAILGTVGAAGGVAAFVFTVLAVGAMIVAFHRKVPDPG
jgi:hypothetical protein